MKQGQGSGALFDALVDDAGLFPPEQLPMGVALRRHRGDVAGGERALSHRFVCPSSRLAELRESLSEMSTTAGGAGEAEPLMVTVVVAPFCSDEVAEALAWLNGDKRVRLVGIEGALPGDGRQIEREAVDSVPPEVAVFVEVPVLADPVPAITLLAGFGGDRPTPVGAKIRCGGVRAELFPTSRQLATAVHAASRHGVSFKATAGLHHAVRYTDSATGWQHHGYLNLLVAACRAAGGADPGEITEALEQPDPEALVAEALAADADPAMVDATRRLFVSYGSCSTSEPVADLQSLGLTALGSSVS